MVPVADGWLVEETVLAARPAGAAPAIARRRGSAPTRRRRPAGGRAEVVSHPDGRPPARRGAGRSPPFGAAAGYAHPATGFSVAASLRAAPRVAAALAAAVGAGPTTRGRSGTPSGRARCGAPAGCTTTGCEVLLRLDQDELADVLRRFFELPVDVWAPYLRIDAPPRRRSAGR